MATEVNSNNRQIYEQRSLRLGNYKEDRSYLCIDLKSFYASVECVERGLDPMTTDLVVADPTRTDKTICLAVSPSLKAKGVSGRARIFEIPPHLTYIQAAPRMQLYIEYAAKIYGIYLDHISKDDMHVYSIDEVFIDITDYLQLYGFTPIQMANYLMNCVYEQTGIRATAGIGNNLYLAKIALDITAKHSPDFIGILNGKTYMDTLWDHKPISDFWRVGKGLTAKLHKIGINTMRDIALCNEDILYKIMGIDAELLIDHAWGIEPVRMSDIKNYHNKSHSLSRGQVLMRDYDSSEANVIVKEMAEQMCLEMSEINKITSSLSLIVGYSNSLKLPMASGSTRLNIPTNSAKIIVPAISKLYNKIIRVELPIRRIYVNFNKITDANENRQISIFDRINGTIDDSNQIYSESSNLQDAINSIRSKFGKDAMFKGMDLQECATTIERNHQIGGHKE